MKKVVSAAVSLMISSSLLGLPSANAQLPALPPLSSIEDLMPGSTNGQVLIQEARNAQGQRLTANWNVATGQVQSFVDGRMVRNASIDQLRQEFEMRYFGRILPASENSPSNVTDAATGIQPTAGKACADLLNAVSIANGVLWVAAGATAVTVGGGLVAGGAGVVTSGIIGFAGRYC